MYIAEILTHLLTHKNDATLVATKYPKFLSL